MDKIVEEAMTNMIKRIDDLEARVEKVEGKGYKTQNNASQGTERPHWLISDKQADLIKKLGGTPDMNMKKKEAGEVIDNLIKQKELNKFKEEVDEETEKQYPKKVHEEIAEGTYEEPSKPLTQKEIDEVGEEALL